MPRPSLIFDLDGTLVDTAPDLWAATNHVLRAHGRREVGLDEIREMVGQGARRLIEKGFERTGEPLPADRLEVLYPSFIDHYSANIAVASRPYPGVVELLAACRAHGFGLAVCTNKLERLSVRLIGALGLAGYFDAVVGPDTIGVAKPDPRPLIEAIGRAGSAPAASLMIGDSETDVLTARAGGIPVVAVSFGYSDRPVAAFAPDHVVGHFDELWPIVEARLGGGGTDRNA